jgi:DNA-dependent metalloprotease WSS1
MSREIGFFTHIREYPRQDEALHILKRIASLVKPIMRARGWRVKEFSEMYPDQANLLGLNFSQGDRILLRLREPYDRTQFLPFEKMVDTMLHELSHMDHGPHDEKFFALWNKLRDELEALMMKGYTGEAFLGRGQQLGGRNLPPQDEVRRLARAEAERRRVAFGSQGHRLGGSAPSPGLGVRNAALESIERRNRGAAGCANTNRTQGEIQALSQTWTKSGFRTQAEENAANEAAIAQALWELVQEEKRKYGNSYMQSNVQDPFGNKGGPSPWRDGGSSSWRNGGYGTDLARDAERLPPVPTVTRPPARPRFPETRDGWACDPCTLHNSSHATACDLCRNPRPGGLSRNGAR